MPPSPFPSFSTVAVAGCMLHGYEPKKLPRFVTLESDDWSTLMTSKNFEPRHSVEIQANMLKN
uniref:Uncharacterized protein n=1 Tax=Leersia perrieri TaxID=77586 RepID=A0A0D9XJF1_9ORYZ